MTKRNDIIQYRVDGMSCAACQARVEKAVAKVPGVESVSVSLLTNSMGVTGEVSPESIISAVGKAGYSASLKTDSDSGNKQTGRSGYSDEEEALRDRETPKLKRRLILSAVFLVMLMYISMGYNMSQ